MLSGPWAVAETNNRPVRSAAKRTLDITGSLIALVVLSPLIAVLSLAIAVAMGHPVFFHQSRPGLRGTPFSLLKFRTMNDDRDSKRIILPDSDRLTQIGRWMRRWSLDELPGLINVLIGEMSLVGPRPLLMQYLERYNSEQARRHLVKPGLTGWAQVNGRNAITWEEKFILDVWYVDNWSFFLDLRILWMTVAKVMRREGISAEGEATMPEFMGTETDGGKGQCD